MVNIRRRRLWGLCSGVHDQVHDAENGGTSSNSASVHKCAKAVRILNDLNLPPREMDDPPEASGSLEASSSLEATGVRQLEGQNTQLNSCVPSSSQDPIPPVEEVLKRRKQYRRRNIVKDHEQMRGVYLKNYKWQAAIKVGKNQVHLGTLNTQQEAVHLYDRAAFVCGREPNFALSQEEKQELRKLNWDDFLAMTRSTLTTNRTRVRHVKRPADPVRAFNGEVEQATDVVFASNDAEPDITTT